MGSLLRRSKSSCRDLICKFCAFFFGKTGIHLRINDTTGDRVDLDIARCKFFCKCFCKGIDAAFACGISNFTGGTGNAPDGRDIDDLSFLFVHHMWDCEPAGGKDGCEVCGDNAVPVIDRHIRQQPDIGNTGIVDEDIHSTEAFCDLFK